MLQITICVGSSCHLKGSYQVIKTFEALIKTYKLENKVKLKASFCLGHCTKGISVKIADELLDEVTISNSKEIFEQHVVKKVIV